MRNRLVFKIFAVAALLLMVVSTTACKKKKADSNVTVRIAIQPSAAFIPLYVARYSGLIEDALTPQKVNVVWQDFESGPPMNASLAAELSDIGVIGDVPTVIALSGATRMKLVGIPASGPDAYAMLARKDDTTFMSWKDLKGKRIATVFGSTGHNFTKKLLEKAGLSFEDIEFFNITASDAADLLMSNAVDAVVIWEPNVTRMIDRGIAKIVALGSETDLRGTNGFVVREEFLASNLGIIKEILVQYEKAVSMLPNLDDETLSKLSAALSLTNEQIKSIIPKYDFSVAVTNDDVKALQDTIRFLVSINNLSSEYRVENYVPKDFATK